MYCIHCGAETKAEYNNCPYCGKALQMVPDYSIYDEDNINIILENTQETVSKSTKTSSTAPQKKAVSKKKIDAQILVILIVILCVLLIAVGFGVKASVNNKNNNSYEYQMKLADEAMFKEKYDVAEKYYTKALELSPNDVRARLKLAEIYLADDLKDKSIAILNEALAIDKENYDVYKKLFEIYKADGNIDAILDLKENVTNQKILKLFEKYTVSKPSVNIKGGSYSEIIKLSFTADKGLEIFYTLDGSNPIVQGTLFTDVIEISESGMHTVKFVALNSMGIYSDIVTETYVLEYDAPADPEVTPNGGTFDTPTYIYISVPEGCSAYYTWDRTEPTLESSKYVSPLLVPKGYNLLSVIIVDDTTGLSSSIYRGVFEYITE